MSADETIDNSTLQQQLNNYRTTVLQTENSGNTANFNVFSYSGKGGYSFGLYQYDAQANPKLVVPTLQKLGFNDTQIAELQQSGGLSPETVASLSAQLQTALSTSSGQAALANL